MAIRGVPAAIVTEVAKLAFHPVTLIYADWHNGVRRLHNNVGDITWGGETWTGAGDLVAFQSEGEQMGLARPRASLRFAANLDVMIAERGTTIRNRTCVVYQGCTQTPGGNDIIDAFEVFRGYFSGRDYLVRAETFGGLATHDMVLTLGVGPAPRATFAVYHGPEDQESRFPGDTAGRMVIHTRKQLVNPPVWGP